jgi:hypothetical protein
MFAIEDLVRGARGWKTGGRREPGWGRDDTLQFSAVDLSRGWGGRRMREPEGVFDTLDDVVEDLVREARKTKTRETE